MVIDYHYNHLKVVSERGTAIMQVEAMIKFFIIPAAVVVIQLVEIENFDNQKSKNICKDIY